MRASPMRGHHDGLCHDGLPPIANRTPSTAVQSHDSDDLLYAMLHMLQNMRCAFPGRGIISAHSREKRESSY
jgi:hypothetical protein